MQPPKFTRIQWGRYRLAEGLSSRRCGVLEASEGPGSEELRPRERRISHRRPVPVVGCSSIRIAKHGACSSSSAHVGPVLTLLGDEVTEVAGC